MSGNNADWVTSPYFQITSTSTTISHPTIQSHTFSSYLQHHLNTEGIVEPCIDKNIINSKQLMHILIKKHIKIM